MGGRNSQHPTAPNACLMVQEELDELPEEGRHHGHADENVYTSEELRRGLVGAQVPVPYCCESYCGDRVRGEEQKISRGGFTCCCVSDCVVEASNEQTTWPMVTTVAQRRDTAGANCLTNGEGEKTGEARFASQTGGQKPQETRAGYCGTSLLLPLLMMCVDPNSPRLFNAMHPFRLFLVTLAWLTWKIRSILWERLRK